MSEFPFKALARLADRIVAGKVVFFVGAGFSLDSEGNDAFRLIARLLARFDALTCFFDEKPFDDFLSNKGIHRNPDVKNNMKKNISGLQKSIKDIFRISQILKDENNYPYNVAKVLKYDYYKFNDWVCFAFSIILNEIELLELHVFLNEISERISCVENDILLRVCINKSIFDHEIDPLDLSKYFKPELDFHDKGKALFLDTMGFADENTMAGNPKDENLEEVKKTYKNRLRPRHHMLARFAKEGFTPILLTTNYDLLLEGGYRLSGMDFVDSDCEKAQGFSVVASPNDFFRYGHGYETPLIIKIHGCARVYRDYRKDDADKWKKYLESMVFTYREIQNWRQDSWSRDYLRTLLRTRTIVFCGYSGMDPVLHDTFRTVYEEMAKRSILNDEIEEKNAPAFFFDLVDTYNFYGMEILRSASKAIGCLKRDMDPHQNLLSFYASRLEDCTSKNKNVNEYLFPRIDHLFRWLSHVVLRKRQQEILKSNLDTIESYLFDRPANVDHLNEIKNYFDKILSYEGVLEIPSGREIHASDWWKFSKLPESFEYVIGWTEWFHPCLLREFQLAQQAITDGDQFKEQEERSKDAYCPLQADLARSSWGVVVEIAVRRIWAEWSKSDKESLSWLHPLDGSKPIIHLAKGVTDPVPVCLSLTFRLGEYARLLRLQDQRKGVFKRQIIWEIVLKGGPWNWSIREKNRVILSAKEIWNCAVGVLDHNLVNRCLGENDGRSKK
ncbi:MAG: SIR2 family protein [Magnetococcus sp. YQC-5]